MDGTSTGIIKKIIIDFLCLTVVALPILLLKLFGQPYHRGFFCDDESIMYPYKSSTVPNYALYAIGLGFPLLVMAYSERVLAQETPDTGVPIYIFGRKITLWISNTYKVAGVFLFGAACSQLTTDIAKYMIGRLRPHFLNVCNPDVDCSNPSNQFRYITEFSCTADASAMVRDARLSFPSGHSSFAAFSMIYLAIYIHVKMKCESSYLIKSLLQFVCISIFWMTGLSRVSDYKHHWTDVTGGFIIGSLAAVITVKYVSNLFDKPSTVAVYNENTALSSTTPVIIDVKEPSIEL